MLEYCNYLKLIHTTLKPKTYVEIGVEYGRSIILANPDTKCYGIDPNPLFSDEKYSNIQIYKMTSDDFFANYDIKNIDLAFIDGMHLFEYALRDFINIEARSAKNGIIIFHDTIPADKITSERNRTTGFWTGDIFKIVLILKKYRPDLHILNANPTPSGLCIVKNLNPSSTVLKDNYENILNEYISDDYTMIENNKNEMLDIQSANCILPFLQSAD